MANIIEGTVLSTKMEKTIIVSVVRKFRHPMYQKVITRSKHYTVHNEIKGVKEGDMVVIEETAPMSKNKHFIVVEKKVKK